MFSKTLKMILTFSLCAAITAPNPAQAGEGDVARAFAAILGIALVGVAIKEAQKSQATAPSTSLRPLPNRVNRKLLPEKCLRNIDGYGGTTRIFGKRCIDRNYPYAQSLPRSCELKVHGFDGPRRGYAARCLRQNGYRISRR